MALGSTSAEFSAVRVNSDNPNISRK